MNPGRLFAQRRIIAAGRTGRAPPPARQRDAVNNIPLDKIHMKI